MHVSASSRGRILLIVAAMVVVLAFGAAKTRTGAVLTERAIVALAPSSERAFAYGSRHFDAQHPKDYDLAAAAYFFAAAEVLDPRYPYLNYQLARIAFLKGDFDTALTRIDREVELHGSTHANAYYVRGLIKGFAGDYEGAAVDYETYLRTNPKSWAAINDYAWILLKGKRYKDALNAVDWGLLYHPENPWLHNSRATALFELGRLEDALRAAQSAQAHVSSVTKDRWLQAYPGNDPLIAEQGIASFREAVADNMHTIELALKRTGKDVQ